MSRGVPGTSWDFHTAAREGLPAFEQVELCAQVFAGPEE